VPQYSEHTLKKLSGIFLPFNKQMCGKRESFGGNAFLMIIRELLLKSLRFSLKFSRRGNSAVSDQLEAAKPKAVV
jgi:hypothetical protein